MKTADGSKGKYPQAREFGKDGKPVKGIDFTDHGRPWDHPILMNTPTNQTQQEELLVEGMQNLLKTGNINV